jgi:hypothetical protein
MLFGTVAPGAAQIPGNGSTAPARLSDIEERLLAAHNKERALAGVPPLRWDLGLAASAARYAPIFSALGRFVHSPRADRPTQGENLWMGTRGAYTPEQMVANWAFGKRYFRPGRFPDVSSTGAWLDVSHYTQLIWRDTTSLGCAISSTRERDYLVCRYSPRGNRDGRMMP